MEVTFFLLPVAVLMSLVSLGLFVWALRNGQFDDLEGPRWRVLFDDPVSAPGSNGKSARAGEGEGNGDERAVPPPDGGETPPSSHGGDEPHRRENP